MRAFVKFNFFQEIGLGERLQNNPFCVWWDVKQSVKCDTWYVIEQMTSPFITNTNNIFFGLYYCCHYPSNGGWRKDDATPVVGGSVLFPSVLWSLFIGWQKGHWTHENLWYLFSKVLLKTGRRKPRWIQVHLKMSVKTEVVVLVVLLSLTLTWLTVVHKNWLWLQKSEKLNRPRTCTESFKWLVRCGMRRWWSLLEAAHWPLRRMPVSVYLQLQMHRRTVTRHSAAAAAKFL